MSALSDKHGRKPMIVWSSLGFAITNLLQYLAGRGAVGGNVNTNAKQWSPTAILYLADVVDGCSSCMGPVCQAYVVDCSPPSSLASNLGIFQGISIGDAFVLAFLIGGITGAKLGPNVAILMAAGFQLLNCLIAAVLTPESNANAANAKTTKTIRFSEVNPITGLQKLFGIGIGIGIGGATTGATTALLRTASLAYFFLSLARGALDAQFINYTNVRFGWTQAQSGPVLVVVGSRSRSFRGYWSPVSGCKGPSISDCWCTRSDCRAPGWHRRRFALCYRLSSFRLVVVSSVRFSCCSC